MDTESKAQRFKNYVEMHGNRFKMLMDAYGDFQNTVAIWKDDKYVTLSMVEEAMEFQNATKIIKQAFRGDSLKPEQLAERELNVKKELGDVFFFWYANCVLWGFDPLEVIQANVEKLADRAARNVIQGDGDKR